MGTCLIANNTQEDHYTIRQVDRQQIKEEVDNPIDVRQISIMLPMENSGKRNLKKSKFKAQNDKDKKDIQNRDYIIEQSAKENQNRIRKMSKSFKPQSKKNIALKSQVTLKSSPSRKQNEQPTEISTIKTYHEYEQDDLVRVQTHENRKFLSAQEYDHIRGLTEQDDQMIKTSLSSYLPIHLKKVNLRNGSIYEGQWLKGTRNGKGKCTWQDGSFYEGDWKNNQSHGKGILEFSTGDVYSGDFVNNKFEGSGVYTYINGTVYDGEFLNDLKHGTGSQNYGPNEKYIGQWEFGKKHGQGQLYFEDGSYYEGSFEKNQLHGSGKYHWEGKKDYQGNWQHNCMSGIGKLTFDNGDEYQGQFIKDKMFGKGVLKQNNIKYTGSFQNGKKHGIFSEQNLVTKEVSKGYWYAGKKIKPQNESKYFSKQKSQSQTSLMIKNL